MKAILPVLDKSKKKPYYLQLYDYISDALKHGEISEGEKLPSLRNLAKTTGLSVTTIEQCYNQLLVEGYIYSKPHSGYYAGKVFSSAEKNLREENSSFAPRISTIDASLLHYEQAFRHDPDCFDFNKWKKCMNKVLTEFSHSLFFQGDPQGEEVLRSQISRYLYVSRGVSCHCDQIIIGAGTQQIMNQLSTILRKVGIENIALEAPGYAPVRNIFRDRGFALTDVAVSENGLAIEKLPANIRTAAYVSPSNNIFTGSVMPVGRRYDLMNWAAENDSYIIEDDYDSELRYFGKPVPALKSLENSNRVIYLGSFSSTLFAAVKISYMVLPDNLAELFSSMAKDYSQTCSKLEQLTLALFMESGNYQTHIKKLRKLYSLKLDAVLEVFEKEAADIIKVHAASSGMSVILKVDSEKSMETLKKEAETLGLLLSAVERDLFIFYYNQLPLDEIPSLLKDLVHLWRT